MQNCNVYCVNLLSQMAVQNSECFITNNQKKYMKQSSIKMIWLVNYLTWYELEPLKHDYKRLCYLQPVLLH